MSSSIEIGETYERQALMDSILDSQRDTNGWYKEHTEALDSHRKRFRVPDRLRSADIKDQVWYQSSQVSIGPLHYGNTHLQLYQRYKVLASSSLFKSNRNIDMCVTELGMLEDNARKFYDDLDKTKNISSDDFVKMLFMDSCFILEVVSSIQDSYLVVDVRSHHRLSIILDTMDDLLLMENQMPLFILKCVAKFIDPSCKLYLDLDSRFRDDSEQWKFIMKQVLQETDLAKEWAKEGHSLLDLYRYSYLGPDKAVRSRMLICRDFLNSLCGCCSPS